MGLEMKFSKLKERFKNNRSEEGGALLTLLGVGSVVAVTSLSVAGAAMFGTIITHQNLDTKQTKNAAESGISEAVSKLSNGSCDPTGSDTTVGYSYQVYHSSELVAPTSKDIAGLTEGCPSDSDKWVSIKSTGQAKNGTSKDQFATYKWSGSNKILPQVITGQNVKLTTTEITGSATGLSLRPTIFSKNGSVSCVDSVELKTKNVNIRTDNPTAVLDCSITGDVSSNTSADLGAAEISGDVCSTGLFTNDSKVAGETIENATSCGFLGTMYGYKPVTASNTVTLTSEQCSSFVQFQRLIEKSYATPTVLDATTCGPELSGILSSPDTKELNIGSNSLTLITDKDTTIKNLNIKTASGPAVLSFVVPSDSSSSVSSSCVNATLLDLENVKYQDGASGMIYSPCSVNVKSSDISGQVYGGQSANLEDTTIQYYPVELINADATVGDGILPKHLVRAF